MYVKKEINARKMEEKPLCNQTASVEIKSGGEEVRIHVVYGSPNSKKANDDGLCTWVKEMRGTNILIGDFNFPDRLGERRSAKQRTQLPRSNRGTVYGAICDGADAFKR